MLIVGTVMGPLHHYYYIYLDKLLPLANLKTVAYKIISDQLIASPATILCFFYGMGLLENKSMSECTGEIKEKFVYTYLVSVNVYFLPTNIYSTYLLVTTTKVYSVQR